MGTNITGIGNANAIGFKSRVTGGIYFPPELKDALVGVWSAYGKSNDSTDRNIIKNKIKDRGGDFVISNAAFKLNSGFGKYEVDFTTWSKVAGTSIITDSKYVLTDEKAITNGGYFLWNRLAKDSFKVKISNIPNGGWMSYRYRITEEDTQLSSLFIREDGIYTLPATVAGSDVDFFISTVSAPAKDWVGLTITQIPSFEGAFVTDGIDDLITSTKTVQEMGITDEITVVSMIHQIQLNPSSSITNDIRVSSNNTSGSNGRIVVSAKNKTGIYGWSRKGNTKVIITKILGDKNDYSLAGENSTNYNNKFSVVGTVDNRYNSSVAWYWTIIANKVLTTDQINQVIAYFNLDRTLKPDILCNVKKQGITNENHAEFGDKLIDYSGNGRDIQLNNIAWDGDSGIGKYNYLNWKVNVTQGNKYARIVYYDSINGTYSANFKGITDLYKSYGLSIEIRVNRANTIDFHSIKKDGIYTMTPPDDTTSMDIRFGGENVYNASCDITITQIPSHAGALCLDGVNDFGKVTGMPIYKDYTIVVDYERISGIEQAWAEALISKSYIANQGAFVLMETNGMAKHSYSFGAHTTFNKDDSTRTLLYQSKYKCGDVDLNVGTGIDGDTLWLGTYRDNYSSFFNGVIYSLMSFPYSMSEFLIERQLKKYKLGTLYPNMVEFRPVIKSNASYDNIVFYYKNEKVENGTYLTVGSSIGMHICLSSNSVNEIKSITINGIPATFKFHDANNNIYQYDFNLTSKSPQKINITIDEYIRYEDIVQPYPVLLRFKDENGNEVSWGGKFKVGSNITRIGSIADPESNLLNGLYSISGLSLNGKAVTSSTSIVEKQMVFRTTATWLLDDNEPKVILSPSRLRIPNSSYKILGYIPDISGHGNHGKINNSAYAGASGANGYPYDYNNSSFWCDSVLAKVVSGELIEYFAVKNSTGFSNITSGVYKGEIKVTGVTKAISENKISRLRIYTNSTTDNELIDITQDGNYNIDIKGVGDANRVFFYAIPNNPNESIVVRLTEPIYIEQVGEYEGAYCLDGVDDFVTIPTLSSGGKQVLMKVNWDSLNHVLYDQRNNAEAPFCIVTASGSIACNQRNVGGNTFIDGILNNHILVADLQAITHNIVLNNDYNVANSNSFIGTNYTKSIYAKMSLYDFMLFDEISTDDKIKELNEYVGIEGNTE